MAPFWTVICKEGWKIFKEVNQVDSAKSLMKRDIGGSGKEILFERKNQIWEKKNYEILTRRWEVFWRQKISSF